MSSVTAIRNIAHQESLQHSILEGRGVDRPLRKITHKGEEEIEDIGKVDKDTSLWSNRPAEFDLPRKGSLSSIEHWEPDIAHSPSSPTVGIYPHSLLTASPANTLDRIVENDATATSQTLPIPVSPQASVPVEAEVSFSTGPPSPSAPFDINAIAWSPRTDDMELPGGDAGGSPLVHVAEDHIVDDTSDSQNVDHDFNELLGLDSSAPQHIAEHVEAQRAVWTGEVSIPCSDH